MMQNTSKRLYHISAPENIPTIMENGLKCDDDGFVYLFENKSIMNNKTGVVNLVSDCIANGQVFLDEYAMIEVSCNGIHEEIEPDNVGEFSAGCQWRVKQDVIPAKYLSVYGFYKNNFKPWLQI